MSNKSINDEQMDRNDLFSMEHLQRMYEFCDRVLEKNFSVSDVGIPYQWVNNWDKENLLFETRRSDGKWRKFSFIDYLWVRVIIELREFGVPYDTIRKVKQIVEQDIPLDPGFLRSDRAGNGIPGSSKTSSLKSLSLLTLLVIETIATKSLIQILIHNDGECLLLNHKHIHLYGDELVQFRKESYLTISLNYLLVNFIGEHELDFLIPFVPLISSEEAEVLKYIREDSINTLTIKGVDDEEIHLTDTSDGSLADLELKFIQYVMYYKYQFIEFETKDEKIVKFKYKHKGSEE